MTEPSPHKDVRMRGFASRVDVTEVCRLVRDLARPLEAEAVGLADAAGRVVASELTASVPVPGFPRSAMDGYAVRGEETFGASDYGPLTFRLIGDAMPGRPFAGVLQSGEAVRIMTGAPLPQGADAVVMAEAARDAGLAFLPLREEEFDLVIPAARQNRPAVQAFCQLLAEPATWELLASHGFRCAGPGD